MRARIQKGIYHQMHRFADLTIKLILTNRIQRATKCVLTAEELFVNGPQHMQHAISVVFLFRLSTILELHHIDVNALLPQALKKECIRLNSFAL